mmetsp:Transcript_26789/g.77197  ORF Transcript_26789/g.77197 Transcript_26789/m.77197 type:complete len:169 (-) Transcript_26789:89-595(-)
MGAAQCKPCCCAHNQDSVKAVHDLPVPGRENTAPGLSTLDVIGPGKVTEEEAGRGAPQEQDGPTSSQLEEATKRTQDSEGTGLVLTFILPDDTKKSVDFTGREAPLGIDLSKDPPCRTVRIVAGSHGANFGIEPGWRLEYVNSEYVGEEQNVRVIYDLIRTKLSKKKS